MTDFLKELDEWKAQTSMFGSPRETNDDERKKKVIKFLEEHSVEPKQTLSEFRAELKKKREESLRKLEEWRKNEQENL